MILWGAAWSKLDGPLDLPVPIEPPTNVREVDLENPDAARMYDYDPRSDQKTAIQFLD